MGIHGGFRNISRHGLLHTSLSGRVFSLTEDSSLPLPYTTPLLPPPPPDSANSKPCLTLHIPLVLFASQSVLSLKTICIYKAHLSPTSCLLGIRGHIHAPNIHIFWRRITTNHTSLPLKYFKQKSGDPLPRRLTQRKLGA